MHNHECLEIIEISSSSDEQEIQHSPLLNSSILILDSSPAIQYNSYFNANNSDVFVQEMQKDDTSSLSSDFSNDLGYEDCLDLRNWSPDKVREEENYMPSSQNSVSGNFASMSIKQNYGTIHSQVIYNFLSSFILVDIFSS